MPEAKKKYRGFKTNIYIQEADKNEYDELLRYAKKNRRTISFVIIDMWRFYKKNGSLKKWYLLILKN